LSVERRWKRQYELLDVERRPSTWWCGDRGLATLKNRRCPHKTEHRHTKTAPQNNEPDGSVDNTFLWKQTAKNATPDAVDAVKKAFDKRKGHPGVATAPLDYRQLAQALTRPKQVSEFWKPPLFDLNNLLIVVEIKKDTYVVDAKGTKQLQTATLGTFTCEGYALNALSDVGDLMPLISMRLPDQESHDILQVFECLD
jgi:hypothetical protein